MMRGFTPDEYMSILPRLLTGNGFSVEWMAEHASTPRAIGQLIMSNAHIVAMLIAASTGEERTDDDFWAFQLPDDDAALGATPESHSVRIVVAVLNEDTDMANALVISAISQGEDYAARVVAHSLAEVAHAYRMAQQAGADLGFFAELAAKWKVE